jgi:hypothetical protein
MLFNKSILIDMTGVCVCVSRRMIDILYLSFQLFLENAPVSTCVPSPEFFIMTSLSRLLHVFCLEFVCLFQVC